MGVSWGESIQVEGAGSVKGLRQKCAQHIWGIRKQSE